jgi:lipid-binding SYLF domain-containing protein
MAAGFAFASLPARADDNASQLAMAANKTGAPEDPGDLMPKATAVAKKFLEDPEWTALRNMLGGATAVAIFPDLTQAGFILAAQGGSGVFMVRHGLTWSDPVFVELAGTSIGFQAGAQVTQAVLVLMSDDGPDRMLKGAFGMGGQASIAIADLGLGGGTSGSGKTGINSFFISYGQGLFAGGAIGGTQITQNKEYNLFAYGEGYDPAKIIGASTGKVPNAAPLQTLLNNATVRAWNAN